MRGKTWSFMVSQHTVAALAANPKMNPKTLAAKAADVVDAIHAERQSRNEADEESDVPNGPGKLHSGENGLGEGESPGPN